MLNLKNMFGSKAYGNTSSSPSNIKRISALAEGQTQVLEMLLSGAEIKDICTRLIHIFESYYADMMATIMLIDEDSQRFNKIAAPSFSESFVAGLEGLEVDPKMGSCGAAAYQNERIIVRDVMNSPLCAGFLDIIQENKICSCCSQPIIGSKGQVVGVFSMMSRSQKEPSADEAKFIESAARLVALAVEKKRSEDALVESEERFRSVFETAGTPIVLTDNNLNIIEWNPAAEKVFGYTREEVLGTQGIYYMVPQKYHGNIKEERARLLKGGARSTNEIPIFQKSGESKTLLWNSSRLRSPKGRTLGLIGVGQDITKIKQTEMNLIKAKKMAESASEAKSNFVANMNHELRTPLAAISGWTNLLLENHLKSGEGSEILSKVKKNVSHLLTIVEDLLDLSRVESGHFKIERKKIDLKSFFKETFSPFSESAQSKGLDFVVNIAPSTPTEISTDPVRFKQILNNIVGNAVKFTSEGRVVVEIQPKQELEKDGATLLIQVKDQGCGISTEQQEEIFKPFFQADSSSSRRHEGTGLGLSIAERLAKALGGSISLVKSVPNRGSTFMVEIQSQEDLTEESPQFDMEARNQGPFESLEVATDKSKKKKKIASHNFNVLLAEDHPDIQVITEHQLKKLGANVDVVENGEQAVDAALDGDYDVILMDIQMPVMDGYNAVKSLREKGYDRPIIALTARSLNGEVERYYDLGFSHCLKKPVSSDSLSKALQSYRVNVS